MSILGDSEASPASGVRHSVCLQGYTALEQQPVEHSDGARLLHPIANLSVLLCRQAVICRAVNQPREQSRSVGREHCKWISWHDVIGTILRVQFTQQVEEMERLWPPPRVRGLRAGGGLECEQQRASTRTKYAMSTWKTAG